MGTTGGLLHPLSPPSEASCTNNDYGTVPPAYTGIFRTHSLRDGPLREGVPTVDTKSVVGCLKGVSLF